jgi:ArsR family metal-binding transcriptional regulator
MSQLGEVEEAKLLLGEMRQKLNTFIEKINPDDNSLPLDGLHRFIILETDCEDMVDYLSDYDSYDPG